MTSPLGITLGLLLLAHGTFSASLNGHGCNPGDYRPVPNNPHMYMHCTTAGELVKMSCNSDLVWSQVLRNCVRTNQGYISQGDTNNDHDRGDTTGKSGYTSKSHGSQMHQKSGYSPQSHGSQMQAKSGYSPQSHGSQMQAKSGYSPQSHGSRMQAKSGSSSQSHGSQMQAKSGYNYGSSKSHETAGQSTGNIYGNPVFQPRYPFAQFYPQPNTGSSDGSSGGHRYGAYDSEQKSSNKNSQNNQYQYVYGNWNYAAPAQTQSAYNGNSNYDSAQSGKPIYRVEGKSASSFSDYESSQTSDYQSASQPLPSLVIPNPCADGDIRYFTDGNDQHLYYECVRGYQLPRACPSSHIWVQPLRQCVDIDDKVTNSVPSQNPCIGSDVVYHPYQGDTRKYIQCQTWASVLVWSCADNEMWVKDQGCVDTASLETARPPSSPSGHTYQQPQPQPYQPPVEPRYTGQGPCNNITYYFSYPDDSTKFIQCDQFGHMFVRPCGPGTQWDDSVHCCVHYAGYRTQTEDPTQTGYPNVEICRDGIWDTVTETCFYPTDGPNDLCKKGDYYIPSLHSCASVNGNQPGAKMVVHPPTDSGVKEDLPDEGPVSITNIGKRPNHCGEKYSNYDTANPCGTSQDYYYSFPSDNNCFIQCDHNRAMYVMSCGANTYWNSVIKQCVREVSDEAGIHHEVEYTETSYDLVVQEDPPQYDEHSKNTANSGYGPAHVSVQNQPQAKSGYNQDHVKSGYNQDHVKSGYNQDHVKSGYNQDHVKSGYNQDHVKSGYNQDHVKSGYNQDQVKSGYNQEQVKSGYNQDHVKSGYNQDHVKSGYNQDHVKSGYNQDHVKSGYNQDHVKSGYNQEQVKSGYNQDHRKSGNNQDHRKSGNNQDHRKSGNNQDRTKSGYNQDHTKSGYNQQHSKSSYNQNSSNDHSVDPSVAHCDSNSKSVYQSDSSNRKKFLMCINGHSYNMWCPLHAAWNQELLTCFWPNH